MTPQLNPAESKSPEGPQPPTIALLLHLPTDSRGFSLKLLPVLGTPSIREGFVLYYFYVPRLSFSETPYHLPPSFLNLTGTCASAHFSAFATSGPL